MLAKVSNGNARALEERGALRFFASKLALTKQGVSGTCGVRQQSLSIVQSQSLWRGANAPVYLVQLCRDRSHRSGHTEGLLICPRIDHDHSL
ncbi:hypothetical protein GDV60_17660 [Pseudomonas sp. DTU12.1]|nr:hypothetical protein GDV60_17660 [Pseudomonas sp. DTU12.1]